MQKLAWGLLAAAVLVLAVLWPKDEGPETQSVAPASPEVSSEGTAESLVGESSADSLSAAAIAERDSERVDAVPEALETIAEPQYPRARIFGEIYGELGDPLSGVKVSMDSVGEDWVDKELYPHELPELRTETDERGAFELEAPLPTSDWISLSIKPDDYHGRAGRDFGIAGGRNEDPIAPGDNDLGRIVLVDAGAFEGFVVDAAGLPVQGARVRLDGSWPGGYALNAETEPDGSYRVRHVPAGSYKAEALKEGLVTGKHGSFKVANGRDTLGINFELDSAPTIAGRVIDEEGQPLANVRLWGWPKNSGQGAGARSGDDGSFRISLPQDEPYNLEATLNGYAKYDSGHRKHFDPGTEGIEVVLVRPRLTTYTVVNAESNAPIETFGLKIITVRTEHGTTSSSDHDEAARPVEHPGGNVQERGDPRFDDFTIVAPGFAPKRGRVSHDVGGVPSQTIRLEPAGWMTGRFALDGKPLANVTIQASADRLPARPGVTDGEDDVFSDDWVKDLGRFEGRSRNFLAEDDGAFRIGDLAAGTYELRLCATGVAPRVLERIRVESGRETDLGDVEAFLPSTIAGRIVLTAGVPSSGLTISLGDANWADDEKAQTTDVEGRFEFANLEEGTHHLWIEPKPGVLLRGKPIQVQLGRAEQREVLIELGERVPARIEARIRIRGQAAAGLSVIAKSEPSANNDLLGETNELGVATGDAHPGDLVYVEVESRRGLHVGRSKAQPIYSAQTAIFDLDLNPGRLTVGFAKEHLGDRELPHVLALSVSAEPSSHRQIAHLHAKDWSESNGEWQTDLGWLAPGDYRLSLHVGSQPLVADVRLNSNGEETVTLAE